MRPNGALDEADARYLEEIGRDCAGWLGPGASLLDLRCEPGTPVRLVARYRLGLRERESAGTGDSVLAAHAALRKNIVVDRLRFGFSDVVDGP